MPCCATCANQLRFGENMVKFISSLNLALGRYQEMELHVQGIQGPLSLHDDFYHLTLQKVIKESTIKNNI